MEILEVKSKKLKFLKFTRWAQPHLGVAEQRIGELEDRKTEAPKWQKE